MYPPKIDFQLLQEAIEQAKRLLKLYEENLADLTKEAARLKQEILVAKAIVELTERTHDRRRILRDSHPLNEIYADLLTGENSLAANHRFLSALQVRQSSYSELLSCTEDAIKLLKTDIADMDMVAGTPLRSSVQYFTVPTNGWSLSFCRTLPWYRDRLLSRPL